MDYFNLFGLVDKDDAYWSVLVQKVQLTNDVYCTDPFHWTVCVKNCMYESGCDAQQNGRDGNKPAEYLNQKRKILLFNVRLDKHTVIVHQQALQKKESVYVAVIQW